MSDIINGLFELSGAFFILPSILKVIRTKQTGGINYLTTLFFSAWGVWNIYFYSHHGFNLSLIGGILLTVANLIWLILIFIYRKNKITKKI